MIELGGVSKSFGSVDAVKNVSFRAEDGRITGLLGPNGAGKTTTLRMISTVLRPDAGSVVVDGCDAVREPVAARVRLGVLPDAAGLYPRLSARENIEYFARLNGVRGSALKQRLAELVGELGMQDFIERRVLGFSHGQRLKVALARALVHKPRNIVLDEPTNGLDVMSTRALRDLIRRLRDSGYCVLFSSHVMQEVGALCDEIAIIAHGRVVAQGSPQDIRAQTGEQDLEEAFVKAIGSAVGAA